MIDRHQSADRADDPEQREGDDAAPSPVTSPPAGLLPDPNTTGKNKREYNELEDGNSITVVDGTHYGIVGVGGVGGMQMEGKSLVFFLRTIGPLLCLTEPSNMS